MSYYFCPGRRSNFIPQTQGVLVYCHRIWGFVYPSKRSKQCLFEWSDSFSFPWQFYCEDHVQIGERFARFAFCKDLDTLRRAAERLQGLKRVLQQPVA